MFSSLAKANEPGIRRQEDDIAPVSIQDTIFTPPGVGNIKVVEPDRPVLGNFPTPFMLEPQDQSNLTRLDHLPAEVLEQILTRVTASPFEPQPDQEWRLQLTSMWSVLQTAQTSKALSHLTKQPSLLPAATRIIIPDYKSPDTTREIHLSQHQLATERLAAMKVVSLAAQSIDKISTPAQQVLHTVAILKSGKDFFTVGDYVQFLPKLEQATLQIGTTEEPESLCYEALLKAAHCVAEIDLASYIDIDNPITQAVHRCREAARRCSAAVTGALWDQFRPSMFSNDNGPYIISPPPEARFNDKSPDAGRAEILTLPTLESSIGLGELGHAYRLLNHYAEVRQDIQLQSPKFAPQLLLKAMKLAHSFAKENNTARTMRTLVLADRINRDFSPNQRRANRQLRVEVNRACLEVVGLIRRDQSSPKRPDSPHVQDKFQRYFDAIDALSAPKQTAKYKMDRAGELVTNLEASNDSVQQRVDTFKEYNVLGAMSQRIPELRQLGQFDLANLFARALLELLQEQINTPELSQAAQADLTRDISYALRSICIV